MSYYWFKRKELLEADNNHIKSIMKKVVKKKLLGIIKKIKKL